MNATANTGTAQSQCDQEKPGFIREYKLDDAQNLQKVGRGYLG